MRYIENCKGEMIDERVICKTHKGEKRKFDLWYSNRTSEDSIAAQPIIMKFLSPLQIQ
jgi:hypothetical protein